MLSLSGRPRSASAWLVIGGAGVLVIVATWLTISLLSKVPTGAGATATPTATASVSESPRESATPEESPSPTSTPHETPASTKLQNANPTPRLHHTATLLADGSVLVAGGYGDTGGFLSAERYDPIRQSWSPAGALITPRSDHTATLLRDGTVLVTGGMDGSGRILASAELYDPRTGSWTATEGMAVARIYHTATLLPDGTVLVAGGSNSTSGDTHIPLASAELYDPSTRSWTNVTGMIEARTSHTATMLTDGSVLVVGGARVSAEVGDPGLLASAELYDYRTGAWAATGSMMEGRADHTATLLPGGAVLVAGGSASPDYQPASAELYDLKAGSWSATRGINAIRYVLTATLVPNGLVAVVGDFGGSVVPATMELYDPSSGFWIDTGRSVDLRKGYAATLLRDGTVLVSGGGPGTTLLGPGF